MFGNGLLRGNGKRRKHGHDPTHEAPRVKSTPCLRSCHLFYRPLTGVSCVLGPFCLDRYGPNLQSSEETAETERSPGA